MDLAAGYGDGLRAAMVGIAANRSLAEGRPVDLAELADRIGAAEGTGPLR